MQGLIHCKILTVIEKAKKHMVVVVVLPDPFRGMGAWRNSTEIQQLGHTPRSGSEIKNGRSGAKDGAPERLECGTVKEEVSQILQKGVRRCLATSTWWCGSRPSIREVGRNGETTTPRGPTIRSPPIAKRHIDVLFCHQRWFPPVVVGGPVVVVGGPCLQGSQPPGSSYVSDTAIFYSRMIVQSFFRVVCSFASFRSNYTIVVLKFRPPLFDCLCAVIQVSSVVLRMSLLFSILK